MSDKEKLIQTPFDKTVPSIGQQDDEAAPGEEQVREDIGVDDDASEPDPRREDGR